MGLLDLLRGNKGIKSPLAAPPGRRTYKPLIPPGYQREQKRKFFNLLKQASQSVGSTLKGAMEPRAHKEQAMRRPKRGKVGGAAMEAKPQKEAQAAPKQEQPMDRYIETISNYAPEHSRDKLEKYYPAYGIIPSFYEAEEEYGREGLGTLLGLIAFNESTLGRGTSNIFGVKPGNESKKFDTPEEALEYQLSEDVLAGGETPEMNILAGEGPITEEDIRNLYTSYDPPGDYLDDLIKDYQYIMGL